jgi:hypothetical protein
MKHLLIYATLATVALLSCQKPISWDINSGVNASLETDSVGNCLPIAVFGAYTVGSALTDSNYIVVPVSVASPGSYYVYTNFANGYSFQSSGSFTSTGNVNVKLAGTGRPAFAQTDSFTVHLNSGSCTFSVNVLQ